LASPILLWTITNSAEKRQKKPQTAVRTRNWPLQVNWLLQESPVPSRQMCDCIFSAKESLHFNMWSLGNRLILQWGQCKKKKKGQPKKTTKAFMVYILSRKCEGTFSPACWSRNNTSGISSLSVSRRN
jgi:hypothetical protein